MKAASPGIIPGISEAPGQYSPALMSFFMTLSPWGMDVLEAVQYPELTCEALFCHLPCKFSGST